MDEITTYLDGRYVSAPEAIWRLSEFNMSYKSHTVIRLAVHLPHQKQVVFIGGQETEAAERAAAKYTTLTAWFQLNRDDSQAQIYTYSEIPNHYVYEKNTTKWKRRQRGSHQVIGRMPVVSVQDAERFYLRMLLLRQPGAVGFVDIRTVDGIVCETFQQACKMRGLLEGDQLWNDTLRELQKLSPQASYVCCLL
ncbi:hypothetical protein JTE90_005080 [Oedothorax gibbosus]|uniref:Uncharacterized protein n=1 Tax=Oedothorax gibbosus TaxID=931172 RepID=A0AAV6TPF6_9ARAC|nr:hypothetical protein JTE90_005080 [Oedothorax gibbosus]